jgi:aerobic-type carbon monoxide dehydrogenase small subunit (CoxS/CutS family)
MLSFRVNGKDYALDINADTPLLWVLRDHLGLTGTKYCCGIGECGACTVHVNGKAVFACVTASGETANQEITTIEGLKGPFGEALHRAWLEEDVPQCGYCQPGQIMTAAALMASKPRPTDAEIDTAMSVVLCRCGTYHEIRKAIHRAAEEVDHEQRQS